MARGIGGDDGPTLFMFAACILIWGWFKTQVTSAKNVVVEGLELGQNSAGPLQAETTSDIRRMENEVKSWTPTWSALKKPKTYYQNIADELWNEAKSSINIDEQRMLDLCKPLDKNELTAVAKLFGVHEGTFMGLTTWSGHIFKAFDMALEGVFKGNERAAMKRIWSVTKLW